MENDWFKDWFSSEEYNIVYAHRDTNDAQKIIDLIISTLNLNTNHYLLDAPCGSGRHLQYLSSLGFNVVGFDLSLPFLIQAKNNIVKINSKPLLFRSDIRKVGLKKKFDSILNLFTSFGYFLDDEENFAFPKNAYDLLQTNGYFVLDYINRNFLTRNLLPYSFKEINGLKVEEKREIKSSRVIKSISITNAFETKRFYESVKLYPKDFILERFASFGYSLIRIFGDYDGNSFNEETSERLIMIFQK
ncbi:MAG: class I SAM-dependent methyltransferase [Ignavibacteria bacterium]|nr:class I SAM-dependent methyltransferase [Ignavibacteria bacterium]